MADWVSGPVMVAFIILQLHTNGLTPTLSKGESSSTA